MDHSAADLRFVFTFGFHSKAARKKGYRKSARVPGLKQFLHFGFVETRQFPFALDDHGTLEQVRIFEHELGRLVLGRRFLLHVPFTIQRRAGIEEILDGAVADNLAKLLLRERVLPIFSFLEIYFLGLQETSCFAASGSRRLVDEPDVVGHL